MISLPRRRDHRNERHGLVILRLDFDHPVITVYSCTKVRDGPSLDENRIVEDDSYTNVTRSMVRYLTCTIMC